jgi:hypothetical protein
VISFIVDIADDLFSASYRDLHEWSVNNYCQFWKECWHYFDVIHSVSYDQVIISSVSRTNLFFSLVVLLQ